MVPGFIPRLLENTADTGHQTLPWCWRVQSKFTEAWVKEPLARPPRPFIFLWTPPSGPPQIGLFILPLC